jgi:hypothetical protein
VQAVRPHTSSYKQLSYNQVMIHLMVGSSSSGDYPKWDRVLAAVRMAKMELVNESLERLPPQPSKSSRSQRRYPN